jgi:hypothetical protein
MTGSRKPDAAELRARLTDEQYRVTLGPPRARFRRRPAALGAAILHHSASLDFKRGDQEKK